MASDRFGVAEQALNAIYLLGEQPDVLASEIIKALTSRVFAVPAAVKVDEVTDDLEALAIDDSLAEIEVDETAEVEMDTQAKVEPSQASVPPSLVTADFASSFELGQLVFVVGHVAIKHIVYLELVERELKRRKEEKTAAGQLVRGNLCLRDPS